MLAVGGGDGKIRLLVPPAFEPSDEVSADGEVTVLAFSSDARLIAWGGPTGARVWDREKKNFATPFLPHAGPVATLAFSADGSLLATSARDMQARVFRIPCAKSDPLFLLSRTYWRNTESTTAGPIAWPLGLLPATRRYSRSESTIRHTSSTGDRPRPEKVWR